MAAAAINDGDEDVRAQSEEGPLDLARPPTLLFSSKPMMGKKWNLTQPVE
jgi:hypothetical protein